MQLKNLGNLQNVLTAFKGTSGGLGAASIFESLNQSTQEFILTSGKLNQSQLESIFNNIQWIEVSDDASKALSCLTQETFENAISTAKLKAANDSWNASQGAAAVGTKGLTAALQGLKTAVLTNPLLMATAVVAGLFAVYKVVDLLTVSFEEQKEIVDGLKTDIEGLRIEYDELNSKGNLTTQEQEKMKMLERQLSVKKELLSIEEKVQEVYY